MPPSLTAYPDGATVDNRPLCPAVTGMMEGYMTVGSQTQNGYTKTGILLVSFLVLAVIFAGSENLTNTARATNAQEQLAQAFRIPNPAPTGVKGLICSGGKNEPPECTSKYVTRYVEVRDGSPFVSACELSSNRKSQLCASANVSGAACTALIDRYVDGLTAERGDAFDRGNAVGETCTDKYRGALTCFRPFSPPSTIPNPTRPTMAPPSQVAAAVLAQANGGGGLVCCKKDDELCKSRALKTAQIGGNGLNSFFQNADFDPDKSGISATNVAKPDSALTDATNKAFEARNIPKPAAVRGAQGDVPDVKSTPIRNAQTTVRGNQSGAIVQNPPPSQPNGPFNPVTRAPDTNAVQRSGAGVAQADGSYQQTGQLRYQSLRRPQLFQTSPGADTGNNQSARKPSVVERFARFIGADQRLFSYQTPQGFFNDTFAEQRPSQTAFIIRPQDASIRNIQEIARDVAQNTTLGGSRVDNFAQTLNVVGGPNTSGRRATTTNTAYGSIQDLIVEDEAIRAMFVAEQTAKRARDRVFCLGEEKSDVCQLRRAETAKRVERQTFVAELEQRNLPQPALEHFLAVYDGWVSPTTPAPKSTPVAILGELNNSDNVETSQPSTATSTSFVSWAWGGVKSSTQKMLDALTTWLTP